jgi:hypothetical protein
MLGSFHRRALGPRGLRWRFEQQVSWLPDHSRADLPARARLVFKWRKAQALVQWIFRLRPRLQWRGPRRTCTDFPVGWCGTKSCRHRAHPLLDLYGLDLYGLDGVESGSP